MYLGQVIVTSFVIISPTCFVGIVAQDNKGSGPVQPDRGTQSRMGLQADGEQYHARAIGQTTLCLPHSAIR